VLRRILRYSKGAFLGPSRSMALVDPISAVSSYLPRMSHAWRWPLESFFVVRAEAGGGGLLSGGIQLATDVLMLPSFPQQMKVGSVVDF